MRLLIQRVKNASVSVGGVELSRIGQGLLALVNNGPVTIWIDSKMRDC